MGSITFNVTISSDQIDLLQLIADAQACFNNHAEVGNTLPIPENMEKPEIDSKGIPWDARIHASSKAITADGTWRRKRGITDDVYNNVLKEIQSADDTEDTPPPPPLEAVPEPTLVDLINLSKEKGLTIDEFEKKLAEMPDKLTIEKCAIDADAMSAAWTLLNTL